VSTIIKIFNNGNTSKGDGAHINERTLESAIFISDAKWSAGRQCFWNRLEVLRELKFGWIVMKSFESIELKKTVFVF